MKEEKQNIQKKIRDLDNTMREANTHLISDSGGKEREK